MDRSQWKELEGRLIQELSSKLGHLLDEEWNRSTSRKVNSILSKRARELAKELNFPTIPPDHVYYAHMWFKKGDVRVTVYHHPANKFAKPRTKSI